MARPHLRLHYWFIWALLQPLTPGFLPPATFVSASPKSSLKSKNMTMSEAWKRCHKDALVRTRFTHFDYNRRLYQAWRADAFPAPKRLAEFASESNNFLEIPCGRPVDFKQIIRGEASSLGAWPWVVSFSPNVNCTGVLISEFWVLTTGSCIPDEYLPENNNNGFSNLIVELGLYKDGYGKGKDRFTQRIHAHRIIRSWRGKDNTDIALILLVIAAAINAWTRPICMPQFYDVFRSLNDLECYVAGMGATDLRDIKMSTQLTQKQYSLQFVGDCLLTGWEYLWRNYYCGQPTAKDYGSICYGDGGSPLMCKLHGPGNYDRHYLWGISAFTAWKTCSTEGMYLNGFLKINHYLDWIKEQVRTWSQAGVPWWWDIPIDLML